MPEQTFDPQALYRTMHCSDVGYMLKNQGLLCLPDWIHLVRNTDDKPLHHWNFKEDKSCNEPRILEVGCGNGQLCNFLGMFARVVGVDVTDSPARQKYSDGWEFIEKDVTKQEFPSKGAIVPYAQSNWCISFDVLEHLQPFDVPKVIQRMSRADNLLIKVACSGGMPLHVTVESPGWWMDTLMKYAPSHDWSIIRNYRRENADGENIYAPLFYGRKEYGS